MNRGRRYEGERKLNMKKVFAVIIAFIVIVMFIIEIKKLMTPNNDEQAKDVPLRYFPVYTDNKWGVINSKGEIIIEPTYDETIIIPDNSKAVFICTYDVDYGKSTYKTKVLNQKNEEIITGYDNVYALENYDNNNVLWYEKDILKVSKDGKYGLVDFSGKQVAECNYTKIDTLKGTQNSLLTTKDGKLGIIDNTGTVILENEYKTIRAISDKYENGYIVQAQNGKYGVSGWNRTVLLETKYDDIKQIYGDGKYFVVKENGKWKIVDTVGGSYLSDKFTDVKSINGNIAVITKDGKYGLVSITDEETLLDTKYQEIKYATNDRYIVKLNDKYGIVDSTGESLIENKYNNIVYRSGTNFYEGTNSDYTSDLIDSNMNVKLTGIISKIDVTNGYMQIREGDEYNYYNFNFEKKSSKEVLKTNNIFLSKKDGKYGFVDKNGIVVVDYIYDDATEQNEYGYAAVKKDGLWGCVNWKGEVTIIPSYKLENHPDIQFIGKWHLGQDLNLYYYTNK